MLVEVHTRATPGWARRWVRKTFRGARVGRPQAHVVIRRGCYWRDAVPVPRNGARRRGRELAKLPGDNRGGWRRLADFGGPEPALSIVVLFLDCRVTHDVAVLLFHGREIHGVAAWAARGGALRAGLELDRSMEGRARARGFWFDLAPRH